MTREIVISVHNLVKKFGNFIANDNLNFEVYRGEIFGFLGANGAGKTTALRILSGLSSTNLRRSDCCWFQRIEGT